METDGLNSTCCTSEPLGALRATLLRRERAPGPDLGERPVRRDGADARRGDRGDGRGRPDVLEVGVEVVARGAFADADGEADGLADGRGVLELHHVLRAEEVRPVV